MLARVIRPIPGPNGVIPISKDLIDVSSWVNAPSLIKLGYLQPAVVPEQLPTMSNDDEVFTLQSASTGSGTSESSAAATPNNNQRPQGNGSGNGGSQRRR